MYIHRNNPFVEREVQKSLSACQLSSKRDQTLTEKHHTETSSSTLDGVLKSHSAGTIPPFNCGSNKETSECEENKAKVNEETIKYTKDTDAIVPDLTLNTPDVRISKNSEPEVIHVSSILRQMSDTVMPTSQRIGSGNQPLYFGRSISEVTAPHVNLESDSVAIARCSERTKRIREARERFLHSPGPSRIRRTGTGSASDLRSGNR